MNSDLLELIKDRESKLEILNDKILSLVKNESYNEIKKTFLNKSENEIEIIIFNNPNESFENLKLIYSNKKLTYNQIHKLISSIYIQRKEKFNHEEIITKDIISYMKCNIQELIKIRQNYMSDHFMNHLNGISHIYYEKGNINLKNSSDNLLIFLEKDFCKNCKQTIFTNYQYYDSLKELKECQFCNFFTKDDNLIKLKIGIIKLIPKVYKNIPESKTILLERVISLDIKEIALYYNYYYIMDFIKNKNYEIIAFFDSNVNQLKKSSRRFIDILYSRVNEIYIDNNEKYHNLYSIELLHKSMGYITNNFKSTHDPHLICNDYNINIFNILVNELKRIENTILFDLHVLNIINYGKENHIQYLYEKYPNLKIDF